MDNFRDRFASRGGRDRYERSDRADRYDRYERDDRDDRYDRDEPDERSSRRAPSYGGDSVQIDDIANAVDKSNGKQLEVIADCFDDVKDEVVASEKEILKAIDRIADSADAARGQYVNAAPAQPAIDPAMKEEILAAVFSNTNLLNSIRETLDKKEQDELAKQAEIPAEAEEEAPAKDPLKEALGELYNNLEDHVHKENVKCYRNVQAALTEQGTQIVGQNKKSLTFLKIFAIINLALTVVNIALLVCFLFGII